jgi:hypothetical protein
MKKFYVKDCPEDKSLFQWISNEVDFDTAKKDVPFKKQFEEIIDLPHKLNLDEIKKDTIDTLNNFGVKGWQTTRGESNTYGGLSIVYNPNLIESIDPNQQTLGTAINTPKEFFYGKMEKFYSPRNTYFDSYGFRKLSPSIENSNLKKFILDFNLSPTRSRIAVLNGLNYNKVGEDFLWHKDEEIFENLRINIPIDTNEHFMFQLENNHPIHLSYGKCYTWDTHKAHKVYMKKETDKKRIHLVLGFSPWINYNNDDDSFELNEFFGKIHPFEILLQGLAHPLIGSI